MNGTEQRRVKQWFGKGVTGIHSLIHSFICFHLFLPVIPSSPSVSSAVCLFWYLFLYSSLPSSFCLFISPISLVSNLSLSLSFVCAIYPGLFPSHSLIPGQRYKIRQPPSLHYRDESYIVIGKARGFLKNNKKKTPRVIYFKQAEFSNILSWGYTVNVYLPMCRTEIYSIIYFCRQSRYIAVFCAIISICRYITGIVFV